MLRFIRTGIGDFNALALEVFELQRAHNPVYGAYCKRQPPVSRWEEIPAIPTSAFKDVPITCFPAAEAVAEFHTSGTTRAKAGKHFFKTMELYDAAIVTGFSAAFIEPGYRRLPMCVLTPSPEEAPHSSLSHMMSVVMREFGETDSDYFVHAGALESERLARTLCEAQWAHQPVFLLGTAFAFVHFMDYCGKEDLRLQLPPGSRVMETGGFKGRSREVAPAELHALLERHLGTSWIVNEYGMTELSTQFYSRLHEPKHPPPWSRVLIINPHTGKVAAPGEIGMIRVLDLANLWSSLCVQTEDLGRVTDDGFEILGRAANAEVRGCSLTAEDFR